MRRDDNVRSSKKYFGGEIGDRYEDQVVPARREGALDLEEMIKKYEEEEANNTIGG